MVQNYYYYFLIGSACYDSLLPCRLYTCNKTNKAHNGLVNTEVKVQSRRI